MKIFSFDAETNGLWGQAFAISATVRENGVEIANFTSRCPIVGEVNPWVAQNVLPSITDVKENSSSYEEMLSKFAAFYMANKNDAQVIVHMGYIVETKVLRDMHDLGLIGDWDAPYPMHDVASALQLAGEDATSVDAYVSKHALSVPFTGATHHPMYDSVVAAVVWEKLFA